MLPARVIMMETYNSNAPKDLLDGSGESLAWVMRLGGGEPYQFCPGKGKCGGDENVAEPPEAIVEGTGLYPVSTPDITSIRISSTIDHDAQDALRVGQ
jgi:hypothetical protein